MRADPRVIILATTRTVEVSDRLPVVSSENRSNATVVGVTAHRPRQLARSGDLGPGMSFGEMAMVNRERRTANVRAIVDTTCYEVAFAGLDDALRSRLLINLAQQLSEKLLRAEREMQLLGE